MTSVILMRRDGRKFYECQWADPTTGRLRTKTTKCTGLRDAERFRAKLEAKIMAGESIGSDATFEDARTRYIAEVLPSMRLKSRKKIKSTFNLVRKIIDPGKLSAINEVQISRLKMHMIERKRSAFTQINHLQNLRQFMDWAKDQRLCQRVPSITMPTRPAEKMRGRPITGEEFDRMIAAIDIVAGSPAEGQCLRYLIRGLYLSGLRLSEALALHWIDDSAICIDTTSTKYPMFRVQGEFEKGKKFRLLPIAPEFWKMLEIIPEDRRTGFVFKIDQHKKNNWEDIQSSETVLSWASKILCRVGKESKVAVGTGRSGKVKFASAHDLRRSFGVRWSRRVPPKTLQQLMRHSSIQTTMDYYVGHDSDGIAEQLWGDAGVPNKSPNIAINPAFPDVSEFQNTPQNSAEGGSRTHTPFTGNGF